MLCYSLVVLLSLAVIYVITQLLHWLVGDQEPVPDSFKASWLFSLVLNLLGYASVLLPGLIIYKYVKASQYLDRAGKVNLALQLQFCCLAKNHTLLIYISYIIPVNERVPKSHFWDRWWNILFTSNCLYLLSKYIMQVNVL